MKNPGHYERAKEILTEQSRATERYVASLAIQAKIKAEKEIEQQKDRAEALRRFAGATLGMLDDAGDPGVEFVKVQKQGLFRRVYDVEVPGWHLANIPYTAIIRNDPVEQFTQFYLLVDNTFSARVRKYHPPFDATRVIGPEEIVRDDCAYIPVLRALDGLRGLPQ